MEQEEKMKKQEHNRGKEDTNNGSIAEEKQAVSAFCWL